MPRPEDLSPDGHVFVGISEMAAILGVSVNKMYEISRSEGFPRMRSAKMIRVPYRKFIEWAERDAE